jgi:hypothetical protein
MAAFHNQPSRLSRGGFLPSLRATSLELARFLVRPDYVARFIKRESQHRVNG